MIVSFRLEAAGVEFIPENGGGAGVRLKKDNRPMSSAVAGVSFPSGTILGCPTEATSPRSCAASYSSANRISRRCDVETARQRVCTTA